MGSPLRENTASMDVFPGEHLRLELIHPLVAGDTDEMIQDARGDALPLVILLDDESDFCGGPRCGVEGHVAATTDDRLPSLRLNRGDESNHPFEVDFGGRLQLFV